MPHRWTAIVAVVVLMGAGTLTACGSSGSGSAGAGSTSTTTTPPSLLANVPQPIITVAYLLQDELNDLGYDVGSIDNGFVTRVTRAMKEFQRKHGLPPTGALDQPTAVALRSASGREEPTIVRSVQSVLTELGIYTGAIDGIYGPGTIAAVTKVQQKVGLTKNPGKVDAATLGAMVDLWRQRNLPAPQQVATTGPDLLEGTFSVCRAVDAPVGTPLGTLYKPLYFMQGWAVHGEPLVPPYPASHGCVRTHDWDQDRLFPHIPVGTSIVITGQNPGNASAPANAGSGY